MGWVGERGDEVAEGGGLYYSIPDMYFFILWLICRPILNNLLQLEISRRGKGSWRPSLAGVCLLLKLFHIINRKLHSS